MITLHYTRFHHTTRLELKTPFAGFNDANSHAGEAHMARTVCGLWELRVVLSEQTKGWGPKSFSWQRNSANNLKELEGNHSIQVPRWKCRFTNTLVEVLWDLEQSTQLIKLCPDFRATENMRQMCVVLSCAVCGNLLCSNRKLKHCLRTALWFDFIFISLMSLN